MQLTEDQENQIQQLEHLWEFTDSKLKDFDFQTQDLKLFVLFHIMGGAHRLIRGFISQLKGGSNDDLESKLRTISEAIINLNYIFAEEADTRARAFVLNGTRSNLAAVKRIIELLKQDKAPAMAEITTIERYETTKSNLEKEIEEVQNMRVNENLQWPKIEIRARLGNGEQTYATAFWLFSEDNHMTASSLNRFMKDSGNGKLLMSTEMDLGRLDLQIKTAYLAYISILNTCSEKIGFPKKEDLDVFNKSDMLPDLKSFGG